MSLHADLRVTLGALDLDVAFDAEDGEVLAVLGPNGSGKSTLLRTLAGLHRLTSGQISLGDDVLDRPGRCFVPPAQRRVGYVPQDLALFPHLDAVDNVAFGLQARGGRRAEVRRDAMVWLERLGVADLAHRRPNALSGGQAQRIALARALAGGPELLLLDEPLSALDAGTRAHTRRELRRHLDAFRGVTVVVTHDPLDALLLAGPVVVIEAGRAVQAGPLTEVTARPRTRYVAALMGTNLLTGVRDRRDRCLVHVDDTEVVVADEGTDGSTDDVFLQIAPSAISLHPAPPGGSPRNAWPLQVVDLDRLGGRIRVHLTGPVSLVAEITPAAAAELGLAPGGSMWAAVKATEVAVYPR